ncbi:MAG TPA: alpha/beta fold hydrolase [Ktedonobacteraceae bacterium]|nr:alpha/beta fold hydrolase [Ktedonobacteraceae bacterium]
MTTSQPAHDPQPATSPTQPAIGVLLVHGLNGSRSDFAEMETLLRSRDMVVVNMLLPGHGSKVKDMLAIGWEEWSRAVYDELRALKQRCNVVFLVGHSLGGALSLHVAAHEEVTGIVTICAPLHMHSWLKAAVGVAKYITPFLPRLREDVRDHKARKRYQRDANAYSWMPMRPVESMLRYLPRLREELPLVTVPALVMISIHDHVVPARDGREIYRLIGSREKHLVTFHRSYHVVMKDHDRDEVLAKTLAFIQLHAGKASPHQKMNQTA